MTKCNCDECEQDLTIDIKNDYNPIKVEDQFGNIFYFCDWDCFKEFYKSFF